MPATSHPFRDSRTPLSGLNAGPDTIAWHLRHRHQVTVSAATVARHLARAGLVVPEPRKRLVRHAGLREARLHDARHTAATVLLLLGVPARTVMSLMGWSSAEMASRYQHVTDTIRHEVARQVDDLIWQARGEADLGHSNRTVQVDRDALAMILRLAELGLAHDEEVDRIESRAVIEQVRTALGRDV